MSVKTYKDLEGNQISNEFSDKIRDYENFFCKDYNTIHSEILNIVEPNNRLSALGDLEKQCWDKYNCFIKDGIKDCFEPIKYYDEKGIALDSDDKFQHSWNRIYIEVFASVFALSFARLKDEIRQLKGVVDIKMRYPNKKRSSNYENMDQPKEIKKEFLQVFKKTSIAEQVIQLLLVNEYIDQSEQWQGLSKNKGELACAYNALKDLQLLKPQKGMPTALVFYERFGLKIPGYASDKTLRLKPYNADYDGFMKLFKPLKKLLE